MPEPKRGPGRPKTIEGDRTSVLLRLDPEVVRAFDIQVRADGTDRNRAATEAFNDWSAKRRSSRAVGEMIGSVQVGPSPVKPGTRLKQAKGGRS